MKLHSGAASKYETEGIMTIHNNNNNIHKESRTPRDPTTSGRVGRFDKEGGN